MKLEVPALNSKLLVKWIIILVVIIALYFGIRKVIKTISSDSSLKNMNAEIKPDQLSYPLTMYASLADQLESTSTLLTTDEQAVYTIIKKMNTLSDLLQLMKSFGQRSAPNWNFGKVTLAAFIQEGMSASEIANINKILTVNNINYSF